jgi:hypothetical protein
MQSFGLSVGSWWFGFTFFAIYFVCGMHMSVATETTPVCTQSGGFLVISRERADAIGPDLIIRKTFNGAQSTDCQFKSQKGDLRFPKPGDDDAFSLIGFFKDRMVLDYGTGTIREVVVVDLSTGKKLISRRALQDIKLSGDKVTFFADGPPGTPAKCPGLSKDLIGNAKLEPEQSLDHVTLKVGATGKVECHYEE